MVGNSFYFLRMLDGITTTMDPRPLIPPTTTDVLANKAPFKESLLMFFAAVGCTVCYTAVLSNLVYYSLTMGVDSYLFLNLTLYGPMLPITIAQSVWDVKFDREVGSLSAYSFRGFMGYSVSLICLLLLPFANNLTDLLVVCLLLGIASATLHGMLKQMASFVYPGCFRLAAAVTAGMQASAAPVLIFSIVTGFGRDSETKGIFQFYVSVAVLLLFCWACFRILLFESNGISRSMERHDSLLQLRVDFLDDADAATPPLLPTDSEENMESDMAQTMLREEENQEESSTGDLWRITLPASFVIILTVASSMSVASFLNRVHSQHPNNEAFAQVLFYIRLLGDLLGRPATLYKAPTSFSNIFAMACARLSFVPVFFVYSTTNIIPKSDIAITIGIFLFAFTSGYLVTLAYQLAPSLLNDLDRGKNLTKQNGIINVCFSIAILVGFGLSFVIDSMYS